MAETSPLHHCMWLACTSVGPRIDRSDLHYLSIARSNHQKRFAASSCDRATLEQAPRLSSVSALGRCDHCDVSSKTAVDTSLGRVPSVNLHAPSLWRSARKVLSPKLVCAAWPSSSRNTTIALFYFHETASPTWDDIAYLLDWYRSLRFTHDTHRPLPPATSDKFFHLDSGHTNANFCDQPALSTATITERLMEGLAAAIRLP